MKALTWQGKQDVRVEDVPDPILLNRDDAIIKVTSAAICGSDLHIYNGFIPSMMEGDILGHEFMGEVVEVGPAVKKLKNGDRVVVPFPIACGKCWYCKEGMFSLCENSNPKASMAEAMYGHAPAGIFGYSHMMGGYAGGQAEYVRVPYADVGPLVVDDTLPDEQLLFLSDILPTGYMAAENGGIKPGMVAAVWGCGPVGQFAIQSAFLLGAEEVIAIDNVPERLELARANSRAEIINFDEHKDIVEVLKHMTGGRGPDVCIDAVGMEAHVAGLQGVVDRAKQAVKLETDQPVALRQAIQACRKGGVVSLAGVYGGMLDSVPFGAAVNKGLTLKMGQTHVQRYMKPLLKHIQEGRIDPSFIVSHRLSLLDAPHAFELFSNKDERCIKVVLKP